MGIQTAIAQRIIEKEANYRYDFQERYSARCDKRAVENGAIVRQIALNFLKKNTKTKEGFGSKRLKVA